MIFYSIILLVGLLFAEFSIKTKEFKSKKYVIPTMIAILPFFMISAFRYGIGTDYFSYTEIFNHIKTTNSLTFAFSKWEPLFVIFNKIIGYFGVKEIWFFIITSFIFLFLIYLTIMRQSISPIMSIYLFFTSTLYFASFNTTHQMVGISILFFSLKYVFEEKIKPFTVLVVLAGLFHYSCFAFLPVYFLGKIKIRARYAVVISGIFFVLQGPIALIIKNLILKTSYEFYVSDYISTGRSTASYLGIFVQLALFIFFTLCYSNEMKYRILYNIQMISLWASILGNAIPLINRVKWMFFLPFVLLVPLALKNINNGKTRMISTLLITLGFFIYYYAIISSGAFGVLPYQSIFQ